MSRVGPRLVRRRGADGGLASHEPASRKHTLVVRRIEAERLDLGDAGVELLTLKGLAGATTATRSPGLSARGFSIAVRGTVAISSAIA